MDSSSIRKRSLSALAFLLSSLLGLVVLANLVSRELHASSTSEINLTSPQAANLASVAKQTPYQLKAPITNQPQ